MSRYPLYVEANKVKLFCFLQSVLYSELHLQLFGLLVLVNDDHELLQSMFRHSKVQTISNSSHLKNWYFNIQIMIETTIELLNNANNGKIINMLETVHLSQ